VRLARGQRFNTTRYSEKLLQCAGISVITIDLSVVSATLRGCRCRVRGGWWSRSTALPCA